MDPAHVDVIVGIDVGKTQHHAVALARTGTVLADRDVANDEAALAAVLTALQAHGRLLVVVDQPGSIGSLPVTVAQARGHTVAYLPPHTMRQMATVLPGTAKTDARDARVIAETAWRLPLTLRELAPVAPQLASLRLLCGHDADLRQQATATSNRLRALLTEAHPALERVLGPALHRSGVLALVQAYPTPAALQAAERETLVAVLVAHGARKAAALVDALRAALADQTVVVAGTAALALVVPALATQLTLLWQQRTAVRAEIEALVVAHPLFPLLASFPGFGVRTIATVLVEIAGKVFPTAADLASYAGVAPVSWQSGTSKRHTRPPRHGNPRLKNAFYQAAFSSLGPVPAARTYYDRKRAEGKDHAAAVLALARRRTDILFAMLRDGTPYQPSPERSPAGRSRVPPATACPTARPEAAVAQTVAGPWGLTNP